MSQQARREMHQTRDCGKFGQASWPSASSLSAYSSKAEQTIVSVSIILRNLWSSAAADFQHSARARADLKNGLPYEKAIQRWAENLQH